jgi:hypothetical protein
MRQRKGRRPEHMYHQPDGTGSSGDPDGLCPACYKGPPPASATVPPGEPPKPQPEAKPEPAKEPRKPGMFARLGFGSRETSPELPLAPPKNPEPTFYVDAKHTIEFASLIYGGARWFCDLLDKFLMTEEAGMKKFTSKHPELLTLSPFEKESITLDPQSDLWGRFATGATRLIGCKTQAQAHSAIDTLSFIGHFGALIAFGTDHFWHAFKDAKPFREAKRLAKKAAIAAKRAEVRNQRDRIGVGEGGDIPQPGPGTASAAS